MKTYMPFIYEHPMYWKKIEAETKESGDFLHSTCLFADSEKKLVNGIIKQISVKDTC